MILQQPETKNVGIFIYFIIFLWGLAGSRVAVQPWAGVAGAFGRVRYRAGSGRSLTGAFGSVGEAERAKHFRNGEKGSYGGKSVNSLFKQR